MTAGYSGTPQSKKLGLVPGARWDAVAASEDWSFEQPPAAEDRVTDGGPADVVVVFVRSAAELEQAIAENERRVFPAGALWVAWPRKAGGHLSDVAENDIRSTALARGLVDVKVAAIDADWSGLKLVWRRENRG